MKHGTALIALTTLLFAAPAARASIHTRILSDGTVEYYNKTSPARSAASLRLSDRYDPLILRLAGSEGVDPLLVKCIIKIESDFNPNAVSVAGAMGLMQIMQVIANSYSVRNPFDPEQNLTAGIKHFGWLMRSFKNDTPLALAAYHAGIGRVKRRMAIPPIRSTVAYVNDVMRIYNRLSGKEDQDYGSAVNRLYTRIRKDGTVEIFN
jgi:soluble lytic murein transglycosylase-like protein